MASTSLVANNHVQDQADTGAALIAVAWTLFGLSASVVGLRLWTRLFRVRHVAIDDYLMIVSLACCAMHSILVTIAYSCGMGRHSHTLTPQDRLQAKKYIVACEAFAIITCMFGRLSFCAFFLGLLGPTHRIQRKTIWTIIFAQAVGNTIIVIQVYAQCGKHMSALWDTAAAARAHCQSPAVEMIFGYVQGAINCLSDFLLTLLPAYLLYTLQVPVRTKAALSFTLTLSIFALAASIVKAVAIQNLNSDEDFTWNMVTLEIWCAVENNVVIITASIPTLGPLFRKCQRQSISPHSTKEITLASFGKLNTKGPASVCTPPTGPSMESNRQQTFSTVISEEADASAAAKIDEIVVTKTAQVRFSLEAVSPVESHGRDREDWLWGFREVLDDAESCMSKPHTRSPSDKSCK